MMLLNLVTVAIIGTVCLCPTPGKAQGSIDDACDPASSTAQCTGSPYLTCLPMYNMFNNGTCRCREGTFWHPQALQCRVGAGDTCANGPDMPVCTPNSDCNFQTNRCTCRPDFYIPSIGSFCVTGLGRPCGDVTSDNAQCDITKRLVCGGPDPVNTVCVCSGRDVWSEMRGKCLATIGTSSACSVDDDCVENAICNINDFGIARCRCAPGFSENEVNQCSLAYGATCDASGASPLRCNTKEKLACSASNSTCACAQGLVAQNGQCKGLAGDACETHADCASASSLLCHQEIKQCFCSQRENAIELVDRTCGRLGINGYCRMGRADCASLTSINYLECQPIPGVEGYGRCGCPAGYQMDGNGRCRRPLGASCMPLNHNCIVNAACIRDKCTCLPDSKETSDGRCLKTWDQFCNMGPVNPCNGEQGLACAANKCQCTVGQTWDVTRDRCVALVSGNCTRDTNYCVAHAVCSERGICECAANYSQYTTYDRHCRASHGAPCNATNPTAPGTALCNDQEYLFCNPESNTCTCEYSAQQEWDSKMGSCVSLVGGHCGTYLGEHMNRRMQCVESAICLQDAIHMSRCNCDEKESMEPDGTGRCRKMAGIESAAGGNSLEAAMVVLAFAVLSVVF